MSARSEVRLDSVVDRIVFKFRNILGSFNKSNPKYVARLECEVFDIESDGRRIASFTVYVSRRDGSVEGDVVIQFYYDLTAREGAFSGLYCDICWLSPEDALDILDLARRLALVFYGGVVV